MHTPHNDSFCVSLRDGFIVMDVCKMKAANTPPTDMKKAGRKSKAKKDLCTPLGVRRQVKTLYLIHLNEVPKSTPYHLRNSLLVEDTVVGFKHFGN